MRTVLASIGLVLASFTVGSANAQAPRDELVLSVDREGAFSLAGSPLNDAAVVNDVAAALRRNVDTPIVVEADEGTPYDRMMRAAVLLQEAGATKIAFRNSGSARR